MRKMMPKGFKHSEETKRKIGLGGIGNTNAKGHKHTEESLRKMKARKPSEETKRKISFALKGSIPWIKGRKHSEESKRKMGLAQKGKILSKETKKKMSIAKKGSKHSEYTKRKIGKLNKIRMLDYIKNNPKVIERLKQQRAKQVFPVKDSSIEVKIQDFLKLLGIEYFTHQYIKIEHGYQCDILIPSMNIVIECDGDYWHSYPIGRVIDKIRTKELLDNGFKVLRLWEWEIREMDLESFKERLGEKCR